ncbi:hypothetical protein FZI85_25130 [Mycobacterium sp. CBMA293]|uniref:hypothetical protein n=1 Tax=unclassified Mycolicibacterium TaxID=2636767 RepID=UPI0012DCD836|nr:MULTISPECIES: hypothetical protein [unclassified Mycolicibacterium]MUL47601.1 hypothetical protein [Mycolicibacterium sp. CBMA 360]MUL61881.1 hypothetical protein [Mycolicibacterium sp. CBMA 335]MUL68954.1 hypothetical protein [Mycolicibacterium sp. CBMA 311]MUL92829.1 hypothetical protein [Mycolicibacterium sp. CBMA 230]MUM08729.1 hypothetical protein [Mycolicibacterium sp. CBMA 213]
MKIRSDLEGVVYVQSEGGVVCLAAGDTVPDGVDVGEHLTIEPAEPTEDETTDSDDESEDLDKAGDSEDESDSSDDDKSDDDADGDESSKGDDPDVEETEHAGRRRGRRSTPRPESDA